MKLKCAEVGRSLCSFFVLTSDMCLNLQSTVALQCSLLFLRAPPHPCLSPRHPILLRVITLMLFSPQPSKSHHLLSPLLTPSSLALPSVIVFPPLLLAEHNSIYYPCIFLFIYLLDSPPSSPCFLSPPHLQYLTLFLSGDSCELQYRVSRMSSASSGADYL